MPFLKIQTNQQLTESAAKSMASRASARVAELLGKPEAYIMVSVETNAAMQFAGTDEPLAYLELKSIGLPKTITSPASRALCDLVTAETGVPTNRIYIEFTDAPPSMWGWNGDTF
jgi:phenylpyruvate tautomerase PptA (4-oxalocrotonate tautomerase family)